jgi:hypothetical protein
VQIANLAEQHLLQHYLNAPCDIHVELGDLRLRVGGGLLSNSGRLSKNILSVCRKGKYLGFSLNCPPGRLRLSRGFA